MGQDFCVLGMPVELRFSIDIVALWMTFHNIWGLAVWYQLKVAALYQGGNM